MICPFVDRNCIERECPGWDSGLCFVETLSNKLDMILNLMTKILVLPNSSPTIEISEKKKEAKEEELGRDDERDINIKQAKVFYPIDELPKDFGENILAVDFGTALSKAAIKVKKFSIPFPIPLAEIAHDVLRSIGIETVKFSPEKRFVEDSLVYINKENQIICGSLARHQYIKSVSAGFIRPAIQNLKQYLIGGGIDVSLDIAAFPNNYILSTQDVLSIYLAYILRLSRIFLEKKEELKCDIDAAIRNFSIPVWEDKKYREDVKEMMRGAISKAFCLEKWFKDDLIKGVAFSKIEEALKEAEQYNEKLKIITGTDVAEPVAAGYVSFKGIPIQSGTPAQIYIVDVGAGSSDFALLTVSRSLEQELLIHTNKQAGVDKGMNMWDNGVRALITKKLIEESGISSDQPNYRIFLARLELELRDLKERILNTEEAIPIDVSPVLTRPLTISKHDLNSSLPVQDALKAIGEGFKRYIKQTIEIIPKEKFDPFLTYIIITGGGSFIPLILDCIRECVGSLGPSFPNRVYNKFIPKLYQDIDGIANFYPLLAVSLGATEKKYPREQIMEKITEDPGTYELGGFYIKGY